MSFRFHRAIPAISIFHNPSSPVSNRALDLLRSATSKPLKPSPGPDSSGQEKPLDFNLETIEHPPTADQVSTLLGYTLLPQPARAIKVSGSSEPQLSTFLSAHPSNASTPSPNTPSALVALATSNPKAFKYPLVVNWEDGEVSVGGVDGVKAMLENLRKRRDGELPADGDVMKPKGWFF